MGICSYVNKMTTTEHDTENMNRHVEQMVQEAILASGVERVMNEGVEENIFSDSFAKEVDEIKMPFTKFQILCKLVAKAIRAYSRTNKIQAEHFQKMLEDTIDAYNTRDKLIFTNEVTQNVVNGIFISSTSLANESLKIFSSTPSFMTRSTPLARIAS